MVARARPVTVSDVAALAAVSVGTASKALNGRGTLRPETRRRVQDAAAELGFQPSVAAQSLRSGRSYTVGLVTADSIGRFSIPIMLGAEDALGVDRISVLLCDARDDPVRERSSLQSLISRRVDGIIVTGRRAQARPPVRLALPVPVVYAFVSSTDPADCSVVVDEADGARRALGHLLATGRTRIAQVTGPAHHHSATARATAAAECLAAAGHAQAGETLFGQWSEDWGRRATARLLASGVPFDAVFAGSDQIARGVVEALRGDGRDVPGDVAVVGFDNWTAMAEGCRPALTTVDLDLEGLGKRAAGLLLDAIGGRPEAGLHTRPCRLVVRGSTVPAA